jgi:hypothetical protein
MNCFKHLAGIDKQSQRRFKQIIRDILKEHTVAPKPNERLCDYLRRHCHRDESEKASEHFASEGECTIGRRTKPKKNGRKSTAAKDRLEKLKWKEDLSMWDNLVEAQQKNEITYQMLESSKVGDKFACICSLDKGNIEKKSRCILIKLVQGKWNICDETGMITHQHGIQDTEDEGPVKEWGLWYRQPTREDNATSYMGSKDSGNTTATTKAGSRKATKTKKSAAAKKATSTKVLLL